jgi:thiol:disulfide interchange protein DsbD
LALAAPAFAAAPAEEEHPVKASLIAETRGFAPGQALTVALRLDQDPGWHTYWLDPGDAGLPTTIEWGLPAGVTAGPILWPRPIRFDDPGGLIGYGYKHPAHLLTEIRVPADFKGERLSLKAQANWLVCKDVCIPGDAGVSLVLARLDPNPPSANAPQFQQLRPTLNQPPKGYNGPALAQLKAEPRAGAAQPTPSLTRVAADQLDAFENPPPAAALAGAGDAERPALLWVLLLAFVGGLLLNLMPCVLPVLSLKAISFVEQAQESRAQGLKLGLAFSAGVLLSFWALAGVVLALKGGGQAVGWGFQFQEPGFVLFMAGLMTLFALNLFGVYEIILPGGAMQGLNKAAQGQGLTGAFGHGLVITLLATPCTAPFLGSALGYAFSAPALELLATFTAVALGLALPYVALGAIPAVHRWLPKPGAWMLRFKELMGFLLLATALWLLWVLGRQTGADSLVWALALLLALSLGAWAWGAWGGPVAPKARRRWLLLALAGGFALALWQLAPRALRQEAAKGPLSATDGWAAWDTQEIARLRQAGTPVFVDFTADWCWTCKVNERVVLSRDDVKQAFAAQGAVLMKADWTRRDNAITEALKGYGRSGVPLYVWYPKGGEPVVLPEVITPAMLLKVVKG